MSDSEFEYLAGERSSTAARKVTKKRKTAPSASRSDSECDTPQAPPKKKSNSKPRPTSKSAKDLFGLLSDDDESIAIENSQRRGASSQRLDSSLTTKVANGSVRRVAQLEGAYYVELRVYNTRDALKTPPEERYKKTLTTLKAQLNTDTPEWRELQKLMKITKHLFDDKEPVFFSNKLNFK